MYLYSSLHNLVGQAQVSDCGQTRHFTRLRKSCTLYKISSPLPAVMCTACGNETRLSSGWVQMTTDPPRGGSRSGVKRCECLASAFNNLASHKEALLCRPLRRPLTGTKKPCCPAQDGRRNTALAASASTPGSSAAGTTSKCNHGCWWQS